MSLFPFLIWAMCVFSVFLIGHARHLSVLLLCKWTNSALLVFLLFHWLLLFNYFLPFSLGLICSSFPHFLRWAHGSLNFILSFLVYTFGAMKFPLITALAAFRNFLKVVFSYSLSSKYFLICSLPGDHLEVYWQLGGRLSVNWAAVSRHCVRNTNSVIQFFGLYCNLTCGPRICLW